jgi:hypothetical protein
MGMRFKVLARNKRWVMGATITESVRRGETAGGVTIRRFTATIRGFRNWKIYQGPTSGPAGCETVQFVRTKVAEIRDRIDADDESVFVEPNEYATELPT